MGKENELGLEFRSGVEIPRGDTLAARILRTALITAPRMAAADLIYQTVNPPAVYADGGLQVYGIDLGAIGVASLAALIGIGADRHSSRIIKGITKRIDRTIEYLDKVTGVTPQPQTPVGPPPSQAKPAGADATTQLVEELRSQLGNITQTNADLRSKNGALEGQVTSLRNEVTTLNKVSTKLNTDNGSLTTQLEELRLRFNTLTSQFGGALQENATLRSDKVALESQTSKLQVDIDKLNQELERVRVEKTKNNLGNIKNSEWIVEWITGQQDFEKRWQVAKSKLQPVQSGDDGTERPYVLDRFKAGMGVVHEVILETTIKALPEDKLAARVRVGLEYLFNEIWPEVKNYEKFFEQNQQYSFLPEMLARIIYIPAAYRNPSNFTGDQKEVITKIHGTLVKSLHPDIKIRGVSTEDSMNNLLKQFNISWKLIRQLLG